MTIKKSAQRRTSPKTKDLAHRVEELERTVADLRKAEAALLTSNERYRSLVETTDDSIYVVDRDCRYLFINSKHIGRMGFTGDEYKGHPYREFHSPEETEAFIEQVTRVFETAAPVYHEHRSGRDGGYFLRTLSPIKGGGGETTAVSIVSKNITRRKKMEEERERLIEKLQDALAKIKTLKGLIPICAWCKKVRTDEGYWSELETYIREHSDADFTHGICQDCLKKLVEDDERKGRPGQE